MNWIQDCSISSTLECWPDKLQTCNCRSKWSVNACLSCSGKAVFWAQLNARRHKEEVLHQCVWSNSSILHLIPEAEKDETCSNMISCTISHQKPALNTAFEVCCPRVGCPQSQQKGQSAVQALGSTARPWPSSRSSTGPWLPQSWNRLPKSHHQHNSVTALPTYCKCCTQDVITSVRKSQQLTLSSERLLLSNNYH